MVPVPYVRTLARLSGSRFHVAAIAMPDLCHQLRRIADSHEEATTEEIELAVRAAIAAAKQSDSRAAILAEATGWKTNHRQERSA